MGSILQVSLQNWKYGAKSSRQVTFDSVVSSGQFVLLEAIEVFGHKSPFADINLRVNVLDVESKRRASCAYGRLSTTRLKFA